MPTEAIIATIAISAGIAAWVFFAVRGIVRSRRKGSGCAYCDGCKGGCCGSGNEPKKDA